MSDYVDKLVDSLSDQEVLDLLRKKPKLSVRRYKPIFTEGTARKKTLGQKYIEALEAGGDVEEVTKKFIDIGTRPPGTSKANIARYLEYYLEKSQESGRL